MYKPESVQEKAMYKIHWDFEIQMDHQIQVRKPVLVFIYKGEKNLPSNGLCCSG